MRKLLIIFLFISVNTFAQTGKYQTKTHTENGYTYETVTNDPLNARVYTLKNGLKVYTSIYKDAPRIQTYIAVRAGSKNDPASATGLAHYLEHILFKGTSKIGTSNWEKEQQELTVIEELYETYRQTKDPVQRTKIYHQIDSVSLVAAGYSIANEYDKMLSNIGATGTNAYTFVEQTVYVNDIPSNQIEKWSEIEAERFSTVVPRLFHTELEAVYEEKNKGMDNDRRKISEVMFASLFPNHQYGTQTTIGTIEHLKNPSITEIKKYFDKYYVPNNMAICLSGDFDPNKTIPILDRYFSKLEPKPIPTYIAPKENPIPAPIIKEIKGPDAESITIAFRINSDSNLAPHPKVSHRKITLTHDKGATDSYTFYQKASDYAKIIGLLLSNGQAGLIDLNLIQKQKVLSGYAYEMRLNDYSVFALGGRPLQGQKLETVTALLLAQLDSIKQGKFEDWLLKAVINDYKISKMHEYESNRARADAFVDAFISHQAWHSYINEIDRLASISREDLITFAKNNFQNNYVVIYKRTGTDASIQKVPKPKISPVSVNREKQSVFYKEVMSKNSTPIEPVFLNYTRDIKQFVTTNKLPVNYVFNKENSIFTLHYVWDIGKDQDPKLAHAVDYMDYLGTSDMTAEQIKKEFYKLGCSYSFSISNDQTFFTLSGLHENFDKAMILFEKLISDPKADKNIWDEMVQKILKIRSDNKLSKDIILKSAMVNYAKYGAINPFTNILSEAQLKSLSPDDLTKIIKGSSKLKHQVLYYGPANPGVVNAGIEKYHQVSKSLKDPQATKVFPFKDITENAVYYVNYDMVQAEIIFMSKSIPYDTSIASTVYLFNEYFGGSMGSLVFQEMRESKALAYAVKSSYDQARKKGEPNYINSYIGTQADKTDEAIDGLLNLIDNMPESEILFTNAKTSGLEMLNSHRITKAGILMDYEKSKKLGLNTDVRRNIYNNLQTMTFNDLKSFQQKYLKGQKKIILVIGSKDKVDFKSLEKYGKVQELTLSQIFGY